MERESLGRALGLRTPRLPVTHAEAGTIHAHGIGNYVIDISRSSFYVFHCYSCDFVSHDLVEPGGVHR